MKTTKWKNVTSRGLVAGGLSLLLAAGCAQEDEWTSLSGNTAVVHRLSGFAQESDFETYAKQAAIDYMRAQVEIERGYEVSWRDSNSMDSSASLGGDDYLAIDGDADGDADVPSADQDNAAEGGAGDFSTTNVQEEGVDEADVVKTDGNHIYVLHAGELVIVEAGADGALTKVGSVNVGGYALEMFISGNSAVVFSNLDQSEVPAEIHYRQNPTQAHYPDYYPYPYTDYDYDYMDVDVDIDGDADGDGGEEPTPADPIPADTDWAVDTEGWDTAPVDEPVDEPVETPLCGSWGCNGYTYTQLAVVDITDRTAPSVIRATTYAGTYVTSRMVDGTVRAVIDSPLYNLQMVWDYGEDQNWDSISGINAMYGNVIEVNTAYFAGLTLDDIMPRKYDTATSQASYIVAPSAIYAPGTPSGIGLQTVVSVNLADPMAAPMENAVFAMRGIIYASTASLYMTTARDYVAVAMESGLWPNGGQSTTGIHRFDISDAAQGADYQATGEVPGRLLDQFCMGEKDGYLRVASTTGDFWTDQTLDNHVYVLQQRGTELDIVGQLDGLGEGEEIYAARFLGDRGFIVTFFQTDPLYTLDLSDPTNPRAVGEWLGPGYSTYLHPWGEDLIISMGEEEWRTAVSLYDVSDFANPALVERYLFDENQYSSALYEHKAFTFNPESGFLALPYSGWTYDGVTDGFDTGIKTFTVSPTDIAETASLSFYADAQDAYEPEAQRSLYIGDYMYGMSRCRLVSAPIADPAATVQSLPLFDGATCPDSTYYYYW